MEREHGVGVVFGDPSAALAGAIGGGALADDVVKGGVATDDEGIAGKRTLERVRDVQMFGAQNKSLSRAIKWYEWQVVRWPWKKAVGIANCESVGVAVGGVEADVGLGNGVDGGRGVSFEAVGAAVAKADVSHGRRGWESR